VALTLRTLAPTNHANATWSTGLSLEPLGCEVDFFAWHHSVGMMDRERDEPLLVIGEAKSFGINSIGDDSVEALKKVAEMFPGAVMVVSSLRDIGSYTLSEIERLRRLALWGRRSVWNDEPVNPLIVLTGAELFARFDIANAWKVIDGKDVHPSIELGKLHTLSDATLSRYLNLKSFWHRGRQSLPEPMQRIIAAVRYSASGGGR
jgi:hypothetical protein